MKNKIVLLCLSGALVSGFVGAQEARPLSKGQLLYLPVYSSVPYASADKKGSAARVAVTSVVSVRNIDPKRPLRLLSARHHDTNGSFLREYVNSPITVPPLGVRELTLQSNDEAVGGGASLVLRWESDANVNAPLVEASHSPKDGKVAIVTTQATPLRAE